MSGAKKNYINCQESIENENCLADSDTLNASFFAPLDIPNFKQANVPDVHSTSLQLQRRIINLESQKENATLLAELTLIKKQKQPLPASQHNLQSTSNNAGSRDTRLNVFRSKRIDLFPRNSVNAFNYNASSTSSDKPFIRRSNSVANLNTQQKQQANNFTDDFHIHSTFNSMELSLNQKFELPSRMVYTLYERTSRGEEFTFCDGTDKIIVVQTLLCCRPPYCRNCVLYDFQKITAENKNNADTFFKYFRWTTVPLPLSSFDVKRKKIEVNFLQKNHFYEITTPNGHIIKFCLSGKLHVCWVCGDETKIYPDGTRTEFLDTKIESYRSNGKATRSCKSNKWKSEEFIPNKTRMSVRRDGSYSALCSKLNTETTSKITNEEWLEITAPDFKLRRFKTTKLVEIVISLESSFPGSFVQICLCTDNVIMVKHLRTDNEDGFSLQKNDDKHVCFSYGKCAHITE